MARDPSTAVTSPSYPCDVGLSGQPPGEGGRSALRLGSASVPQGYVSKVRELLQVTTGCNLPDYVTGKDGKGYPASGAPAGFGYPLR